MRVSWTGGGVSNGPRTAGAVLDRAAPSSAVSVEDLSDAALGCIGNPIFSMTDLVELDVLELGVRCHCSLVVF